MRVWVSVDFAYRGIVKCKFSASFCFFFFYIFVHGQAKLVRKGHQSIDRNSSSFNFCILVDFRHPTSPSTGTGNVCEVQCVQRRT